METEVLIKNITKERFNNEAYENAITDDYANKRTILISETEYRNAVLEGYFVSELIKHFITLWPSYEDSKQAAIKQYEMTFNIVNRVMSQVNEKQIGNNLNIQ